MKSNYLIICTLLLIGSQAVLRAQQYQTFFSDREVYFADDKGNIECVRIDKKHGSIDSVFYSFSNMRQTGEDCYKPTGPSWIGERIKIYDNGINKFYNKNGDAIAIKTDASINETWTVFELPDSLYIIGKVIDLALLEFLDQTDSVKTISFEVYDKFMIPISHPVNDITIQLSKHFGIVTTLNFSLFPHLIDEIRNCPVQELEEYELVGLSKPDLGVQNVEWFDVFNFRPRDEIHVLKYNACDGEPEIIKTITRFLSRTNYPSSIVYTIEVEKIEYISDTNPGTHTTYIDTLVINQNLPFNNLPREILVNEYSAWSYSIKIDENYGLIKTEPGYHSTFEPYADTCWMPAYKMFDGWVASADYYKGLGGPYFSTSPWPCYGVIKQSLEYYKKGAIEWGTPFNPTSLFAGVHSRNPILIGPNPAKEFIIVEVSEQLSPYLLELCDLAGKIILQLTLSSGRNHIPINSVMPGLYLYRLIDKNGNFNGGKLVIE